MPPARGPHLDPVAQCHGVAGGLGLFPGATIRSPGALPVPGSTARSRRSPPVIRMPAMALADGKILVHLKDRRRLVVDVHDVYYLEAQGDETDIRLRSARGLRDVRSLGEVMPATRFAALLAA